MPPPGGLRTSLSFTMSPNGPLASAFQPAGGMFSPGMPLIPPDPQPTRVFDFALGQNTILTPRPYEPFSFSHLRSFANVEMVRLAIETRKDQIERLDWQIRPKDKRKRRADADSRIRRVQAFWSRPDGTTPFATWMRESMEDLLVIDAPAFEKRRDLSGKLIGLDVVPGDTIKLLVDETGRRPTAPVPAYQQVIRGRVWNTLTTDDLIYVPRNKRPNHLYGYGPVEQIIVTCNIAMRRQAGQLFHFSDGNAPPGLLNAPDGWTPDQIKDFQDWFDARLSGNQAERSKLLWGPAGAKYQAFKDPPLKDEHDEWLARVICYAFSLPPTPFIKQMNRATAENADSSALEEGREPQMLWVKRLIDDVTQNDLECPDLEFAWNIPQDIDPEKQAKVHDLYLRNGTLKVNDVLDDLGRDPVSDGGKNLIYTAKGAVPLGSASELQPDPNDTDPAPSDDATQQE